MKKIRKSIFFINKFKKLITKRIIVVNIPLLAKLNADATFEDFITLIGKLTRVNGND